MTIIRPNSISGINSITAKNTDQMKLYDSNGSWSHVRAGVITATSFSGPITGSTGTFGGDVTISGDLGVAGTLTYEDVARVDAIGLSTYREGLHIGPLAGIGLTAYKDGSIRTTGVVTATQFYGGGGNLTGISQVGGATGVDFNDDIKARWGTGNDLELYHGSGETHIKNNTGPLIISTVNNNAWIKYNSDNMAKFSGDAEVALYYDNSKKFETLSTGAKVTGILNILDATSDAGATNAINIGAGADLKLYHDGSHSYISDTGTGSLITRTNQYLLYNAAGTELMLAGNENGNVELYHDGTKKFETKSDGATISGHLYTGTNKIITSGWGAITAPESQGYEINSIGSPNKYMIQAKGGGSVYLYFNGDKKFETRSDGIKVTGDIQLDGANGTDLKIKTSNAAGIIYQADENGHDFQTWSNSAWRTGLKVADSGQVTKPRTPHFSANGSPSIGTNNGVNYVAYQFSNVPDNTGSHFSNSTGRFTAPVAGTYLFGGALWCNNGDDNSGTHLLVYKKNGSEIGFGSNHRHNKNQLHATMCVGLSANDYITLGFADGSGGSIQGSTPRNYFWGYLVG